MFGFLRQLTEVNDFAGCFLTLTRHASDLLKDTRDQFDVSFIQIRPAH